jgi:hypothetical protein
MSPFSSEEGIESIRGIEARRFREGDLLNDSSTWLKLPDDLKLLAKGVVFDG